MTNLEQPEEPKAKRNSTTEELREQRQALEARIAAAQKKKEQVISQNVQEREVIVAERIRLIEQSQEAEDTLKFFEQQQESGLLDSEGEVELEELKKLVSELKDTRDKLMERYDAIMANPEVYDKVEEGAHKEKQGIDFKEREAELKEELTRMGDAFIEQARLEEEKLIEAKKAKDAKSELSEEANKKVLTIDKYARAPYTIGDSNKPAYLDELQKTRDKVGTFEFKRKSELDKILKQRPVFEDADKKREEFRAAIQNYDSLVQEAGKRLYEERWKLLTYEAEKSREMEAEFSTHFMSSFLYKYVDLRDKGLTHASIGLSRYEDAERSRQRREQAS